MRKENNVKGDQRSKSALSGSTISWTNDLSRHRIEGPAIKAKDWGMSNDSTIAVHAGTMDDDATGAVGTPIYQTSTFVLGDSEYTAVEEGHARDKFIYTRYGNPSQWAVQNKLAALEGAESALVFSSGMAAITATVMALMDKGAHVVASNELYGGTYNLFNHEFPTFGMSVDFVDPTNYEAIEAAIQPNTQILYFEVLTNPLLKLIDIARLAEIAKKHRLRLVVDATFVTPIGCKSLALGADIVIHSCTKYLNGHSDIVAGCIMGSRKLVDMVWPRLLNYGGSLDPHAAFMLERGLKTLAIRMNAHQDSAFKLASYLASHPKTSSVRYPLLKNYPQYELGKTMLKNASGMISFTVEGGDEAAKKLASLLKLSRQATSLGGVESLVSLPFNTSHASSTIKQRENMGIMPGCVRMSVGIEDGEDLIADFEQALAQL
ncbi:methionine gamma-lyase [Colwellia sp. KU-HH00111]|uniref:trans-sulfuration enzyme family protein n=1 Tax=Colwellia sp. KU-HH00111 TaxID=3127652 RepID=UPI003101E3C0